MEIAVISTGFCLPKTQDEDHFWDILMKGESLAAPYSLPQVNNEFNQDGKINSSIAVTFDQIDGTTSKVHHSLFKCLSHINEKTPLRNFQNKRSGIFLGNMYLDEEYFKESFNTRKKKLIKPSPLKEYLNKAMEKYSLKGERFIVDAACASSLAAVNVACKKLIHEELDFALTGGVDANMRPSTFSAFSKVNTLSQSSCRPFDQDHDGLIQGEGCVLLGLMRLKDALKDGYKILGILRSIGGSSDGKATSLFSPTVDGQLLAYQRAHQRMENKRLDYIEAHGTGTKIGDTIELESLSTYFKDFKIPIGSIKRIYGHTLAAAGSLSLLKALKIIEKKVIPPSPYFKKFSDSDSGYLYINKKAEKLPKRKTPIRVGVNSFGFGGANFHLVIEEYIKGWNYSLPQNETTNEIVINSTSKIIPSQIKKIDYQFFNIPPNVENSIDKAQVYSLIAVYECLKKLNFHTKKVDPNNVAVVSAKTSPTNSFLSFDFKLKIYELLSMERDNLELKNELKNYPEITEASPAGILTNVCAGRSANFFNFRGKNFNVDSGSDSFASGLNVAKNELFDENSDVVVFIWKTKDSYHCWAMTTKEFSKSKCLPIEMVLEKVCYNE